MKRSKLIEIAGLSLATVLVGVPSLAQQPATEGTLLVSAPGALGTGSGKPSPAAAKSGAAQGEGKPQIAPAGGSGGDACSPESPEGCNESEAPRTGLLITDSPAPRAGASSYGSMWFSSPSYGGSGGAGISPRTFSAAAAGGGMGSSSPPFLPGPGPILPSPGILPNICLP